MLVLIIFLLKYAQSNLFLILFDEKNISFQQWIFHMTYFISDTFFSHISDKSFHTLYLNSVMMK